MEDQNKYWEFNFIGYTDDSINDNFHMDYARYHYNTRVFEYDGELICEFPDLPGCSGVGSNYMEAVLSGLESAGLWLEDYDEFGCYPL